MTDQEQVIEILAREMAYDGLSDAAKTERNSLHLWNSLTREAQEVWFRRVRSVFQNLPDADGGPVVETTHVRSYEQGYADAEKIAGRTIDELVKALEEATEWIEVSIELKYRNFLRPLSPLVETNIDQDKKQVTDNRALISKAKRE